MITFGKKMSFRPLILSLISLFAVGSIIAGLFGTWGWLAGIMVFVVLVVVHYPGVLELEYNYFEITDHQIRYYDLSSWWKKFLMIFSGTNTLLVSIDLDKVVGARTVGKEQGKGMSPGLPYSNFLSAFSGLISTVRNLYWIEIKLEDGQHKYFSLARDKAYETDKTISKANLVVDWILASKETK